MKEVLITSSVLILAVIGLRLLFRTRVSRRLIYGAWLLVALRLLVPIQFGQLNISILNQAEPVTDAITDIVQRPISGPSREELFSDALQEHISQGTPVFVPEIQAQVNSEIQHSGRPAPEIYDEYLDTNQAEDILLPEVSQEIESTVSESASPTFGQIALLVWIAGAAAMAGWLLGVNMSFRRNLCRTATEVFAPGAKCPVKVSNAISSPCLFGLLRPTVYLTPTCTEDTQRLRHVLIHEQAHLRHGDHIWAWVRCVCLCIYWFNPLVWVAAILSKRDCELACDEAVMHTLGDSERLAYGKTLVDMVAVNPAPGQLLETATAMHETKKQLKERVNCIVKKPKEFFVAAIALLLVLTFVTGCAFSGPILRPAGISTETTPPTTVPTTSDAENQAPALRKLTVLVCDSYFHSWNDRNKSSIWPEMKKMLAAKGVELEFIIEESTGDYEQILHQVLTGTSGPVPDVIWLHNISAAKKAEYAHAGYFTSIDDILNYSDGTASAWFDSHPVYRAKAGIDGKLWWFGSYTQSQYNGQAVDLLAGAPSGLVIRQDWMEKLGMTEIPNTIEELEAFLLDCRKERLSFGRGEEMAGISITNLPNCTLNSFYGVPCAEFTPDLITGQVVTPWESDGVKDVLRTCKEWIDKGYLDPETISGVMAPLRNNNRLAFHASYFCDNWSLNPLMELGIYDASLVGVLPDKALYPNAYVRRDVTTITDRRSMAITSACQDPEAAAAFLDVITSEEFELLLQWGVEGYGFAYNSKGEKLDMSICIDANQNVLQYLDGEEYLDGEVFPNMFEIYDMNKNDDGLCLTDLQLQQHLAGTTWDARFITGTDQLFAAPTKEELAVLKSLDDYNALSQDIFHSILLGQIDIDTQWESHVLQPLKAAGMDELKAVRQAQFDRFTDSLNS